MKRPTQVDVARLAGVSRATVSYVINGQTKGRVKISDETQQRVIDAIATLGYVPDAQAQALRSGSTNTIGVVLPDVYNPHFWQYVDGIQQEAYRVGYRLILSSSSSLDENEDSILEELVTRRIDGLILQGQYPSLDQENGVLPYDSRAVRRKLPVVTIGAVKATRIDSIWADYRRGTDEVMDYLLELGHTKIGFINGVKDPVLGLDRVEPYREKLAVAGIAPDEALMVRCGPAIDDGYEAAMCLLQRKPRPSAMLVINDLLAIGALRAAADLKIQVPEQLSIVSYDDIPMARHTVPRLTTVSKDPVAFGRRAVQLLLARMRDPELPTQKISMPVRFIIRETTGPAPA
ncbi:MAG: LacI family DNA-binding transcriptional regulator [Anaerolineales bacterium]|nr:LacI family DNA-binding transcriptional regulator [Anaerolineales bacterium]